MNSVICKAFAALGQTEPASDRGPKYLRYVGALAKMTKLSALFGVLLVGATTDLLVAGEPAISFRTVAVTGDSAPATTDGALFLSFGTPTIDNFGRATFSGFLESGGVTAESNEGFWTERAGALDVILREGDPVPGMSLGTTFGDVDHSWYPASAGGANLFGARVRFPDDTTRFAHWTNHSGSLEPALPINGELPVPGGTANPFFLSPLNMSQSNIGPAFSAQAFSPQINPSGFVGIWGPVNGSLGLAAYTGQQVPGSADGVVFSALSPPRVNSLGHVAFNGAFEDPDELLPESQGIFLSMNGNVTPVVRAGDPVPGAPPGAEFVWFHDRAPSVNNNGQVAFFGQWFSETDGDIGVWAGGANDLRFVAAPDSPAPGMPAGVTFSSIQNAFFVAPPISAQGATTFRASLQGPGINNDNRNSIWSEGFGSLGLVAQEGQPAPGADAGFVFDSFGFPSINGNGQVTFMADVRDPSGATMRHWGLWAHDINGILRLVAHVGMEIELAEGDIRTIRSLIVAGPSGGEDGLMRSFNDRGELAFTATFTDNTSAVLVAIVPEPTSALFALFLFAIWRRQRNRRN